MISALVNGRTVEIDDDPESPLVLVLRERLGLRGTKVGCGEGACGACTVLIDGEARHACRVTVAELDGSSVVTIEGLGDVAHPSPVQRAFVEEQATQCGYCAPGMVVAVTALLGGVDDPTEAQIDEALAGQVCRCGAHLRILRAVRRVVDDHVRANRKPGRRAGS